jgi:hypothetical protein
MSDNSPAIYRRENSQNQPSSEGTAEELSRSRLSRPCRDFMGDGGFPGDKSPGYYQMFLRNKPEAQTPASIRSLRQIYHSNPTHF